MSDFTLDNLAVSIRAVHEHFSTQLHHAINVSLTLRNWLIGWYIAEYQLRGADRAKYGDKAITKLAMKLSDIPNCDHRGLYGYLAFYRCYPRLIHEFSEIPHPPLLAEFSKLPLHTFVDSPHRICGTPFRILDEESKTSSNQFDMQNSHNRLTRLSYNHFVQLTKVSDETARRFYETECMRGNWSVRELKRQIASMYYERTALSTKPERLSQATQSQAEQDSLRLSIRDPYVFDFLGLKPMEVVSERSLEEALIGKLQDFLLELGRGFCFEARQKRLLIGDEYFTVDLVFYHRLLKCHVLIDLKDEAFSHENIGQLNSYVAYYQKHEMAEGDNPPIGILLCTQKNNELVEYALAGMNQHLFVSQYLLNLPDREAMAEFIRCQRAALEDAESGS